MRETVKYPLPPCAKGGPGVSSVTTPVNENHLPEGVSRGSWLALGATRNGTEWHIPERDEHGAQIGIHRRLDQPMIRDGKRVNKLVKSGSKRGLTMAWPLPDGAGADLSEPLMILEGQTDVACAMDHGFTAIGRPGAALGADLLVKLLKRIGKQQGHRPYVVIMAENDESGAGATGAERLADKLTPYCASIRIVFPPEGVKDLREWITGPAGADRVEIVAAIEAAETWKPVPADAQPTRPTWQPYPTHALPGTLRRFIETCAEAIGCDPSYLALPLITCCASCIGNTRLVQPKRGWCEPSVFWSAIVGESGTLKTPAFRVVMKPLRETQAHALRQHAERIQQYEQDKLEYERALSEWKRSKTDDDPPEAPEEPQAARFIVNDTTVEALAPLLKANPRGLLLARDELAGWLGSMDRYAQAKGGDAPHWLSMHGAEQIIVDRKTGATLLVPRAAVSVTGGIQPGVLGRALGQEHRENGMAARLLLAMPPRRPKRWTEAEIPPAVEAELALLIDKLLELCGVHNAETGEIDPVVVPLSTAAKALFKAFYDRHADEQAVLSGELAAAYSKLEGYTARLALVLHFVRWAAGEPVGEMIDTESMSSAITLIDWHKHEVRRVYGALNESDEQQGRRHLVEWIEGKGGRVTVRELTRGPRQYRGNTAAAEAALEELAKDGWGRWEQAQQNGAGRPGSRAFVLSPHADGGDSGDGDKTPADKPLSDVPSPSPLSPKAENGDTNNDDVVEV